MKSISTEFDVYLRFINLLQGKDWKIVCASPPGGTDNRFRKCLLPRRDLQGSIKGLRDEVDLTAHNNVLILLAECKSSLSDSLTVVNALGESDYFKLKRLINTFDPQTLSGLIQRGTGIPMPQNPLIALALVVGAIDCDIPEDINIFEVKENECTIITTVPLTGYF